MTETLDEKAQRLVDEGRVEILHDSCYGIIGRVNDDADIYTVIVGNPGIYAMYYCRCGGNEFHVFIGDDCCVHALAVKLTLERLSLPFTTNLSVHLAADLRLPILSRPGRPPGH